MVAPAPRRASGRATIRFLRGSRLLGHQLDDELLADVEGDVRARRQGGDAALEGRVVALQPGRHREAAALLERVLDVLADGLARADRQPVARPQLGGRDVAAAAVDVHVAVGHELARAAAAGGEAQREDRVVQPALQQREQVLAGVARHARSPLEVLGELPVGHAVEALEALLLAQLRAVLGVPRARPGVLAGREVALGQRALAGLAAAGLEEELHALPAAQLAGARLAGHVSVDSGSDAAPLARAAAVVRDGRAVLDGLHLEAGLRQGAHGGLAAGAGPAHADLDVLDAQLQRLAGGALGRLLRGEGRALAAALVARAAGAVPHQDLAVVRVAEADDGVVEGRLDVDDRAREGSAHLLRSGGHGSPGISRAA